VGYEDANDADRLCRDPAMRWVVGDRAIAGLAASASQISRFETKWLCRPKPCRALRSIRPMDFGAAMPTSPTFGCYPVGCEQILLPRGSKGRRIRSDRFGIRGMSGKASPEPHVENTIR